MIVTGAEIEREFAEWLHEIGADTCIPLKERTDAMTAIRRTRRVGVIHGNSFFSERFCDPDNYDMDEDYDTFAIVPVGMPFVPLEIFNTMDEVVYFCRAVGLEFDSYLYPDIPMWAHSKPN